MKRRKNLVRRGDLRIAAAALAVLGLAIVLNQPGTANRSPIQPAWMRTWTDSTVLRLNLPESIAIEPLEAMPTTLPPWPTATAAIHVEPVQQPRLAHANPSRELRPAIHETPD